MQRTKKKKLKKSCLTASADVRAVGRLEQRRTLVLVAWLWVGGRVFTYRHSKRGPVVICEFSTTGNKQGVFDLQTPAQALKTKPFSPTLPAPSFHSLWSPAENRTHNLPVSLQTLHHWSPELAVACKKT